MVLFRVHIVRRSHVEISRSKVKVIEIAFRIKMWKKVLRFLIQLIKNILPLLLLYSFILYCTDEILFYQFLDSIYFFLLAKIIKIHTFYKKLTNEPLFYYFP